MIKNYECLEERRINLVNSDDEKLKELGLKPLYYDVYPRYINLHGNVFYGGNSHYQCRLSNDIVKMLQIMNSNIYERFEPVGNFLNDSYPVYFQVYKNQIFFNNYTSLCVYKKYPHIREDLKRKYKLIDEYYEPTNEDFCEDYAYQFFCKEKARRSEVESVVYNLTPREYLDIFYELTLSSFRYYKDSDEITYYDVRTWLNGSANIFKESKCSLDMNGVYNKNAMNIINNLLESKRDIYESLYNLANKTDDMQKLVHDLLVLINVFYEVPQFVISNPFEDDLWAERCYLDNMFVRASFDVLVQLIGFDKIETQLSKTITTTKANIYEEFYNLILLGYDIVQIPRIIFDEDKQKLRWVKPNEFITTGINRECEEDLKLIKKYVPFDQRYKYLRK